MVQLRTYRVTAPDDEGREYVYTVKAPSAFHATNSAYWEHRRLFDLGDVPSLLTVPCECEEV